MVGVYINISDTCIITLLWNLSMLYIIVTYHCKIGSQYSSLYSKFVCTDSCHSLYIKFVSTDSCHSLYSKFVSTDSCHSLYSKFVSTDSCHSLYSKFVSTDSCHSLYSKFVSTDTLSCKLTVIGRNILEFLIHVKYQIDHFIWQAKCQNFGKVVPNSLFAYVYNALHDGEP